MPSAGTLSDLLPSAITFVSSHTVTYLSRGIDVNTRHWDGNTALHAAALMGHKEAVTFLLERGADPAIRDTHWKANAAGKARYAKHTEIAAIIERH
jgi:ankyrin repeat protein